MTHTKEKPTEIPKNPSVTDEWLDHGVEEKPSIRTRGSALFMDGGDERIGMSFCNAFGKKWITTSPGFAALRNGSTERNSMKRKFYEELPVKEIMGERCRMARLRNKVVALFEWREDRTPFSQVNSVLLKISKMGGSTSKRISIDAMVVGYSDAETVDYLGTLEASKIHEVIVYENRGQDLSFLLPKKSKEAAMSTNIKIPSPSKLQFELSGSTHLQARVAAEKKEKEKSLRERAASSNKKNIMKSIVGAFGAMATATTKWSRKEKEKEEYTEKVPITQGRNPLGLASNIIPSTSEPTKKSAQTLSATIRPTKEAMGIVSPPTYRPNTEPADVWLNAFSEFISLTSGTLRAHAKTCEQILEAYRFRNMGLLRVRLEEANAAIYNNLTSQTIHGHEEIDNHMAAFSMGAGFVFRDEEASLRAGRPIFKAPLNDPVLVISRFTRIMLEGRIMEMAERVSGTLPDSTSCVGLEMWINGVPGCGKTTWVADGFDEGGDIIITTTVEAASDLRERLAHRVADTNRKIRTMASMLVNGVAASERERFKRLILDEALMNHFGAIVMAARLTGAGEIIIIGDMNQLPYIDRENLFPLRYHSPSILATISQELSCTHRCPLDVAYALNQVYSGIYSSSSAVRSLQLKRFKDEQISGSLPDTLYLVYTQDEKNLLLSRGFGSGSGSRILTVHEAQGLTCRTVVIVRASAAKL